MTGHDCTRLATIQAAHGREVWVGELDEVIEGESPDGHPYRERYCLHIQTPYQEVTFGLDGPGDAQMFFLVGTVLRDAPPNGTWIAIKFDHQFPDPENDWRPDDPDEPLLGGLIKEEEE